MKKISGFLLLFLLSHNIFSVNDTTKVLFVGNSLTYFNDMPQIFEDISNSLGENVSVEMHAIGGAYLVNHVVNQQLFGHFRKGDWDCIILQPGAYEFGGETFGGTPVETSLMRIRLLLDSIYFYNPCTEIILYEISNGVTGNSSEDIAHYNYTMDVITDNTVFFSDSAQISFTPVGECFRTSWNNDSTRLLWNSYNDFHPNYAGSYLAACAFYSTIFNKPTLGSVIDYPISEFEDEYYQILADTMILNYSDEWNITEYSHISSFDYDTDNELTIFFENRSVNYDSLYWDFGDGTFSTEPDPVHEYVSIGHYFVSLMTYYKECVKSYIKDIPLGISSAEDVLSGINFKIYPNPAKDLLNISSEFDILRYEIFDISGKLILWGENHPINVSDLRKGIYFIRVYEYYTNNIRVIKWVKGF